MKKKIMAIVAAAVLITGTNAFAFSKTDHPTEENPLDNDLFDVAVEIDSAFPIKSFDYARVDYDSELGKAKVMKITVDYDGNVKQEALTDYVDPTEASSEVYKYGLSSFNYNERYETYNDGLIFFGGMYKFQDVNGNFYMPDENAWRGDQYGYNLGLITEYDMSVGEQSEICTNIYTVFTDDMDYTFTGADITPFDDNGYAIMQYKEKSYVIKLKRGVIPTVFYDGEKIKFDQIPVIENGRTLVPLRAIFEKLGADVNWDEETQTVTAAKDGTMVSLTIDNTEASKNGETITLDTPAKVIGGRTLVPVRFIADCFGVGVDWDGVMQKVILTSK